jgi:tetratricopeptide (TPR) repeat protein
MIGDYEGAKECWEYAAVVNPKSPTPFNNLGDLYAHYLKDNKKAEENFLIAIKNGPDQIYIYRSLYEFYRYVMKDNAKAKQILERGISANPNTSQDLKNLLDNF